MCYFRMVNTRATAPKCTEIEDLRNLVREQREVIEQMRQNAEPRVDRAHIEREEREAAAQRKRNVAPVKEFLKLKPPTFPGGMDPIRANEWITEIEKNFKLLRCTDAQKVEIGSYLLVGEANRWWNLKSIAEPEMN